MQAIFSRVLLDLWIIVITSRSVGGSQSYGSKHVSVISAMVDTQSCWRPKFRSKELSPSMHLLMALALIGFSTLSQMTPLEISRARLLFDVDRIEHLYFRTHTFWVDFCFTTTFTSLYEKIPIMASPSSTTRTLIAQLHLFARDSACSLPNRTYILIGLFKWNQRFSAVPEIIRK